MTRTAMIFVAAAAAALSLPAIASAEPKPEADAGPVASVAVKHTPRYCVVDTPTGSHIERRTCKPLEGWLAEGFDPRVTR